MSTLSLNLFGGFDFRDTSGTSVALPTRKAEAIFTYLAMNLGKDQSREKLAALLWEEKADTQARANLRKTLSRLRLSLPDEAAGWLITGPSRVALSPDIFEVDVARFEDLASAGTPDCLEQAAAIYRATFLDGFLDCSDAFDDWVAIERRRLEELARSVLERLPRATDTLHVGKSPILMRRSVPTRLR